MKKLSLCALILLVGCVSSPSKNELSNANYGELPNDYQNSIKSSVGSRLKDPYSAIYEFGTPYKGWCQSGFTTLFGWIVPFSLNAKNSYGGYTGISPNAVMFIDGVPRDINSPMQVGGCGRG